MSTPTEVVLSFLDMWNAPGGFRKSIVAYFTDESVYENIGMSRTVGLTETLAFIDAYEEMTGGGWLRAETHVIATAGDMVLTERTDEMIDGQGKVFLTIPVMGAFQVRGDKIIAWRDYFDTRSLPPYDGPGRLPRSAA